MKNYRELDEDQLNNVTGGTESEDRLKVLDAAVKVLENPNVLLDVLMKFDSAVKNNVCPLCGGALTESGNATVDDLCKHLSQYHNN